MFQLKSVLLGAALVRGVMSATALTGAPLDLFQESMSFLDDIYDPAAGYMYDFSSGGALTHTTRSSPWYAAGLLQRNRGDDREQAIKILKNVIGDQYKDPSSQWYGDYTKFPETPTVGTSQNPQVIYGSWDPNWRSFVGVTLIVIYEEFGDLLTQDMKALILESMYNSTVGDSYRVGGVDNDNLYPCYSNPWLMRTLATAWTGRMWNNTNMTESAETDAKLALELFNLNNTLSEFNSPTYASTSLTAVALWSKYLPEDSLLAQNGARMVKEIWNTVGEMYHPGLKNIAGPFDRAYGFDMNKYVSLIGLNIWALIGKKDAPMYKLPWVMSHNNDYNTAPLIAIVAPYMNSLVSNETIAKLKSFAGEHTYRTSAYSPPVDLTPRNITAWLGPAMSIGAQSFDQTQVGGFANSTSQWNPAAIQWKFADSSLGYMHLVGTEKALHADVQPGFLNLTYPKGTSKSKFQFRLSQNPLGGKRDIWSLADIENIDMTVSGTVNTTASFGYCGQYGGVCDDVNNFAVFLVTYLMPEGSTETPNIQIKLSYK
ncbi:uncharacterized protein JN550_003118 [Neoarthrinium moseri]|uniref:uncharacterized protein n=1 Tax=Neoarthrinium moseri TaxID=1658444 RepID=UPI001FDDBBAD|nr:uncharacterized protein JN550_003118 [Neoarthrinium moseri]KAI1873849.1 hypothetical protein JN550_003118 [Neoarthrinium moseri]